MNIRNVKESDYDRVMEVMVDWWGGRDLRSRVYPGLFLHFSQTGFMVEDDHGKLIAFLLGYLSQTFANEAYINWIGVHTGHRDEGIARMLYEHFIEVARAHKRNRVTCGTALENQASFRWHQHMGFSVEEKNGVYFFSREI
ncbi:MAG: GNAT family N-acetyltransferase [Proteobacteria bacterium]|nr:GNAT family N-acetyltransferase [Pseudomonadota bacterium]MBU4472008.1 GNAT family N-acetyltransferase [Pseudomonadota bacterium]MCG2752992.1 GNAT family N-acetyltransferase [Desulfobacteraceae bacterium]